MSKNIPEQLKPWFRQQARKALMYVFVGLLVAVVSLIRIRFPYGPIIAVIACMFSVYGYLNYRTWKI